MEHRCLLWGLLGEPGMPYNLLLNRSTDFGIFFVVLKAAYHGAKSIQLGLGAVVLFVLLGTLLGYVVGVLPGLNRPAALAIAIPLSFYMSPLAAIAFLMALVKRVSFLPFVLYRMALGGFLLVLLIVVAVRGLRLAGRANGVSSLEEMRERTARYRRRWRRPRPTGGPRSSGRTTSRRTTRWGRSRALSRCISTLRPQLSSFRKRRSTSTADTGKRRSSLSSTRRRSPSLGSRFTAYSTFCTCSSRAVRASSYSRFPPTMIGALYSRPSFVGPSAAEVLSSAAVGQAPDFGWGTAGLRADWIDKGQRGLLLAATLSLFLVLVWRWWHASPPLRRVLLPVPEGVEDVEPALRREGGAETPAPPVVDPDAGAPDAP